MGGYIVNLLINKDEFKIGKILISVEECEMFINNGLKISIILIMMILAIKIGKYITNRFVEKQVESDSILSLDTQRAKTLGEVIKSILKYSVYFIGITSILSVIFGKITYTFAGIGGAAIGLGAQSIIKDVISGFFLLFENQYGVGDYVTILNYEGIVQSIGIRTTVIKDFNGDVHCVSNGSITSITNYSKAESMITIDLNINYNEEIGKVIKLLTLKCQQLKNQNEDLTEIEVLGVEELSIVGVKIRIIGRTKPLKQWDISRKIRKELKEYLQENKIRMAYIKDV